MSNQCTGAFKRTLFKYIENEWYKGFAERTGPLYNQRTR